MKKYPKRRIEMATQNRKERKAQVIEVLNKARSMELQAIHQYLNQHYNLANMDYGDFAVKVKLVGLDEMRHAEKFADRIEELGGQPTVDPAAKAIKGQKVEEVFGFDANLEDNTVATYNEFLAVCRENGDSISAKLLESIIDEEQIHYNYFDNVSQHIKDLGATYLATIAGTPSSTGLASQGFVIRFGGGSAPGGA
jgi:bacterioferritin